ncbi:MAG: L-lactate permease [Bacteroidetes bacterium]|nr:L-lactate permease [Bacteroidota bacterium]MCH8524546.1 L-lactate permease [Balneolales bacterium]
MDLTLLSLLPFLVLTWLLLVQKLDAAKTLFIVSVLTAGLLYFFWDASAGLLIAASLKGVVIGIELFLIIIGVMLLFFLLKHNGRLDDLERFFKAYSEDERIHIIIIGWFFVSFLEGVAGFGTPAAIAAPLLVVLGIKPILAVILTLMADSAAVAFGAFGTTVVVGIANAVPGADLAAVTATAGIITAVVALFMPLYMLFIYSYYTQTPLTRNYVTFALASGAAFSVPFLLTALFIGPELPSVIGSTVGLVIIMALLKKGFFFKEKKQLPPVKPVLGALMPYAIVVALLFISRANLLGFGDVLFSLGFTITFAEYVKHTLSAYTPGVLILVAFGIAYFMKPNRKSFEAFGKALPALLVLIPTLAFAQLIITSELTSEQGIPQQVASLFTGTHYVYLLFAPLIGAFGSFIAGSATVSNLMLGAVQASAAGFNALPETLVIALQVVGAAAGNMIAIHNIVAVLAVVNLQDGLPAIIRNNFIVAICFVVLAALTAALLLAVQ